MCGIAGKIYFDQQQVSEEDLLKMAAAVAHRGPEAEKIYLSQDKKVGLGFRRLAIVDLSARAMQPMSYLDRYQIVFNGEIYNFQELRSKLEIDGYKFKTKSDTEVILALYYKFGVKCLDHLRGMFSLAIYDEKEKTLFCARDRVGKKPFKYYLDDKVFLFASELKAILTQSEYKRQPDYEAINHYLSLQYAPSPSTGFKGIKKLSPAHFLFLDLKTKKMIIERYWQLDYSQKLDLTEDKWKKVILEKLEESVALRMISDVPVGAFLSGGVDSSAVVAIMSRLSDKPIKTFSVGFEDEKYDESEYAKIVANKFKTDHTELIVGPESIEILPGLVRQYEEPFGDNSEVPTYLISKLAKESVTVALNGDGGDENFAGYTRYSINKFSLWYDNFKLLNMAAVPITNVLKKLTKNTFFGRSNRFAMSMSEDYRQRYLNYVCYFSQKSKTGLLTDNFWQLSEYANTSKWMMEKFDESRVNNKLDQTLYADFVSYLPDDLMTKMDMATMSVALEGRSPFLDHELLELTAKIPYSLKLKGQNNKKYILKETLRGLVPDEVMFRPKMGFGMPLDRWFREDWGKYAESILLSNKAISRDLFKKEKIKELLSEHKLGNIDVSGQIWVLLTLELWFREYFD